MSTDIAESLPKRKFAQAAIANAEAPKAPKAKKGGGKKGGEKPVAVKGGGGKGATQEGSEKRVRQAVYDIRYRARREDIDLKAAFAQYMSNSSLSQAERTAVRAKLFGKAGGVTEMFTTGADELAIEGVANALYKVFVEKEEKEMELAYIQQLAEDEANRKYKVRVTDKNGRSYVRFADRAKITELRQNPNIESVEMTDYGEPYEGERKRGEKTARAKGGGLDPVGREDKDVNNDGKVNKTDKYLMKRRKAIGKAIRTRAEAYLADGTISTEAKPGTKKITGKNEDGTPVNNYESGAVTLNPDDGSKPVRKVGVYAHLELNGGTLSEAQKRMIEMYDEKKKKDEKKDKVSNMMTKTSVKKDDEKEEEKSDTRAMYAKINIIKNKLRAAGQRDPMVMAVDACEEKIDETIIRPDGTITHGAPKRNNAPKSTERTPAKDDPSFSQEYKDNAKKAIEASKKKGSKPFNPGTGPKPSKPSEPSKPSKPSEPVPEERPRGPKTRRPLPPKKGPRTKRPKPRPPIRTGKPKYNPYGTGTANPENMSGSTGP